MPIRKGLSNMKLKGIRAYGFKSFADKMEMEFKTNITAIVGPNGSGKSNIVDAVRWVLGEQSVKNLRGSSAMSDVIFAGSETRAPFKRCEVALTFDNTTHFLNTDLVDVEVKRILYYTGENEYYINNVKVRLKDLTNLFLDSGIGGDAFNIISQGNIETIVNSKPIDRRVILESAAQVLKYKNRKTESLRKLDKTKDNLEKVDLVIDELSQTLTPLEEQSKVAKKYVLMENSLKDLEIALTVQDITSMHEEYQHIEEEQNKLTTEKESLTTTNLKKASLVEEKEMKLLSLENKIEEENNHLISLNENLAKLTSERTLLLERQKYTTNAEKIDEGLLALKEQEAKNEKERALVAQEIEEIENTRKEVLKKIEDLDEKTSLFTYRMTKFLQEKEEWTKKELVTRNEIEILENNLENDVQLPYAVKNVLNHPRLKGIKNTIGKLLEVDDEYTVAVDVALANAANFIVVETSENALEAIQYLKENKLGRATFFPMDSIRSRYIEKNTLESVKSEDGFIGVLSDLVKYEEPFKNIIENQLGNVLVVQDGQAMKKISRLIAHKFRVVTLDGEITHAGGSITGGSLKNKASFLQMRQELETLKRKHQEIKEKVGQLEALTSSYDEEKRTLEEQTHECLKEKMLIEESLEEKKKKQQEVENTKEEIAKQIAGAQAMKKGSIEESIVGITQTIQEILLEKERKSRKITEYKTEKSEISSWIAQKEMENKKVTSRIYQIDQSLKEYEVRVGKLDTKMDYLLALLSDNYHLTYEKARMNYVLDVDEDVARMKVSSLKKEMKDLGVVNLGSIEEYERIKTRYDFLDQQREDLQKACDDLLKIIAEMDEIMEERLKDAFAKIAQEFAVIFKKLFKGGTGLLKLTDPDNMLETGIEIIAQPPGKKLNSIQLLSGGEKTLTAIALLFAILNVYPVPFCILDEVEAALDEANVDTFGKYLQEQKDKSEFILITHKKRTMEYADTLYGITMQEQGVSKIVSVKLEGEKNAS